MVNFARELARRGYPVLRFDYMGTGDSEGDFADCSIDTKLCDIHSAILSLREKVERLDSIGLIGLRFGAAIAASAATVENVKKLVLWEPVLNGDAYMREMLRTNVATQGLVYKEVRHNSESLVRLMQEGRTVNVDGYEMGWNLFSQSRGIDLTLNVNICSSVETLIVHISRSGKNLTSSFESLKSRFQNCRIVNSVEDSFWKEIPKFYSHANGLFKTTIEWIEGR
jgi:pimeloyl-ACP methyl ester carboxylesterase